MKKLVWVIHISLRVFTASAILNCEDVLSRITHPNAYGRLNILYLQKKEDEDQTTVVLLCSNFHLFMIRDYLLLILF
jgi:hypothetical protein